MTRIIRSASLLIAVTLSGAAFGASGPITSQSTAARGVMTSAAASAALAELDGAFVFVPRSIVNLALGQLRAATTYDALLVPTGVTLPCAASGDLTARITHTRPTVLELDWSGCTSSEFGARATVDGPVTVTWAGATLSPVSVTSIRLGDANRDYVSNTRPEVPQPYYGGTTMYRNQRATGVLPLVLADVGYFTGRYLVEAKGVVRRVQRLPEYDSTGQPSAELYEYEGRTSTDGAILTGNYAVNGLDNVTERGLISGKVAGSYTYPSRPLHPDVKVIDEWYRGTNLVARSRWDNTAGKYFQSIDGKIEADLSRFRLLGCAAPDTFVYRTRQELGQSPYAWDPAFYDSGEFSINGNTSVSFRAAGTQPYFDLIGYASVRIAGIGRVDYDYTESILLGPLFEAARCTP